MFATGRHDFFYSLIRSMITNLSFGIAMSFYVVDVVRCFMWAESFCVAIVLKHVKSRMRDYHFY